MESQVLIHQMWDPAVICFSFVVSTLGAYPAVILISSMRQYSKVLRPIWIITLASMSLSGVGIWSMHFVGMKALDLGVDMSFDYGWTFGSLLFGFIGCEIGFSLMHARIIHSSKLFANVDGPQWWWYKHLFESPPYLDILLGSFFVAFGVCAMHFTGMHSMAFQGVTVWVSGGVAGSCLLAWVVSFVGLLLCNSFKYSAEYPVTVSCVIAAAVCGMHYTGMRSAVYHKTEQMERFSTGIPRDKVEIVVALISLCSCSIFAAVLKQLMVRTEEISAGKLRKEHERYYNMISEYVPESLLKRLMSGETNVVQNSSNVTIMFCDLAGFTALCEQNELQMVRTLVMFFGAMDNHLHKYGVVKIKTVGDCYMCVTNCPAQSRDHVSSMLKYSVEALAIAARISNEFHMDLRVRFGIHTGDVVSGVVGYNKACFDIWGSSVNHASRMESTGVPGGIQISESSKNQLDMEDLDTVIYPIRWTRRTVAAKGIGSVLAFLWVPDEEYLGEMHLNDGVAIDVGLDWVNKLAQYSHLNM